MSDDWATGVELPSAGDADDGFGTSSYDSFDDIATDGIDSSKIGSGQMRVDRKGWGQFVIRATPKPKPFEDDDMSKARKPSVSLLMTIQASEVGVPVGSVYYHDLILGGKGAGAKLNDHDRDRTLNFLVGTGVLVKQGDQIIDPETGTTKIRTATLAKRLDGKIVIGKLEETPAKFETEKDASGNDVVVKDAEGKPILKYPARIEFPWGRGVFHPSAKEVAHHKWLNFDALKAAGYSVGSTKPNV